MLAVFCSCNYGIEGRFCKHQAAIYKHYDQYFLNAPSVDVKSRNEIAKLAFGDKT